MGESEYEAGLIGRRSALGYHGPWMWNKILAQNPEAELDGFFFPANADGVMWQDATTSDRGSALYVANLEDENFEAAKQALYWWTSPEVVRMRAEAIGFMPAMDMSEAGGIDLISPQ